MPQAAEEEEGEAVWEQACTALLLQCRRGIDFPELDPDKKRTR